MAFQKHLAMHRRKGLQQSYISVCEVCKIPKDILLNISWMFLVFPVSHSETLKTTIMG